MNHARMQPYARPHREDRPALHAIYHEGWLLSTKVIHAPWEAFGAANPDPLNNVTWELYNLNTDYSQTVDLAAKNPAKVKHTVEFDFKYDGMGPSTLAFNSFAGVGRPAPACSRWTARSSTPRRCQKPSR